MPLLGDSDRMKRVRESFPMIVARVPNELVRDLDTKSPIDDVIFDLSKSREYEFSIAVFDSCGRGEIPPGRMRIITIPAAPVFFRL